MSTRSVCLALFLLVVAGPAQAGDEPVSTRDAATLLSRFPAGRVPASPPVFRSIEVLGDKGTVDHVGLLEALARDEDGRVADEAARALSRTRSRHRDTLRSEFATTLPGPTQVHAWLAQSGRNLRRTDGSPLGRTERRMVAYAALVLGPPRTAAMLRPAPPTMAPDLLAQGLRLEDQSDAVGALTAYAQAAAAGDADAMERIRDFGVDPEWLLLGMTADARNPSVPRLEPEALDGLLDVGQQHTVDVLLERTRHGRPLGRAVAIDALGTLIRVADLEPHARAAVLQAIDEATRDPRPDIRQAARTTLAEAKAF
jgi:hypothetical protein